MLPDDRPVVLYGCRPSAEQGNFADRRSTTVPRNQPCDTWATINFFSA